MEEEKKPIDTKQLFSAALLAGEILLSSGAEIYRVEDTIGRILKLSGSDGGESFVTPTCIHLTLRSGEGEAMTTLKRVFVRENNLARVAQTNAVARSLCGGEISLGTALEKLSEICRNKVFPEWVAPIILLVFPACFFLFFGGTDPRALLTCLATGAGLALARVWFRNNTIARFFVDLLSAAGVAFLASLIARLADAASSVNLIIISSIMPLVPGVAITTAIRDVLHGDYQSGTARVAEAFLTATAVAVGVGAGIALYRMIPW